MCVATTLLSIASESYRKLWFGVALTFLPPKVKIPHVYVFGMCTALRDCTVSCVAKLFLSIFRRWNVLINSVHFLSLVLSNFNRKHHTLVCTMRKKHVHVVKSSLIAVFIKFEHWRWWRKSVKTQAYAHACTQAHTHLHIMNAWNFVWGWLLCMRHLSPSLSLSVPLFRCRFLCFHRSHTTRWLSEFQSYPREMSEKCHSKQFQMSSSSMLLYLTTFTSRSFHFVPFIYHSISNRDTLYWRKCVKRAKPKCWKAQMELQHTSFNHWKGCSIQTPPKLNRNQTAMNPKNFINTPHSRRKKYINIQRGFKPASKCARVRLRVCDHYLFC